MFWLKSRRLFNPKGEKMIKHMLYLLTAVTLLVGTQNLYADNHAAQNKKLVTEFYNAVVNEKDFAAAKQFLGPHYIQHNPTVADGATGLQTLVQLLRDKYPRAHGEIKQIFVDGDYVILHVLSRREPDARGRAVVDIFKLDHGKVVEHWDVAQDIPEKSANTNGMF